MLHKILISILLFSSLVGCAAAPNIYVDGMPVSDHEYTAVTKEGLKTSFILTRYYEKQFDDETMIYPEYLDLFDTENKVDASKTETIILHVKIVNIVRTPIIVWLDFKNSVQQMFKVMYRGKLPRKDLSIPMPTANNGKNSFEVVFAGNQEELFRIWGEYTITKGGAKKE